jgi:hypothetical protein
MRLNRNAMQIETGIVNGNGDAKIDSNETANANANETANAKANSNAM